MPFYKMFRIGKKTQVIWDFDVDIKCAFDA